MRFKLESSLGSGWSVDEVCSKCGENKSECTCNVPKKLLEPAKHQLVFKFERRNGKPVTIVGEFFLDEKTLKELLSKLKKSLSCGGAEKSGWIELQGDIKEKLRSALEKEGFRFRK